MFDNIIKNKHLLDVARQFPSIAIVGSFIVMFVLKKKEYMVLFALMLFSEASNKVFKSIAKYFMGNKKYPIIGYGLRPNIAESGPYKTKRHTYGMPSGHSEISACFSSFLILFTYFEKKYSVLKQTLIILSLLFTNIYVMFSRVYEKWHTVQQTVIGTMIGYLLGYIAYKVYKQL